MTTSSCGSGRGPLEPVNGAPLTGDFVGEHAFFSPTLNVTRVEGHLQIDFDRDAFTTFVATVFAATVFV